MVGLYSEYSPPGDDIADEDVWLDEVRSAGVDFSPEEAHE
jgi:hypothetical protein